MKIATGEYVWYVDADDYLDEDACESLYLYSKIHDLDMLSLACIDFKHDTGKECEIEDAMNYLLKLRQEYFEKFHF